MKRALLLMLMLTSGAQALTLSGTVNGELPENARVSAWLVSNAGSPLQELVSAPLGTARTFSLALPDTAPSGRARWILSPDTMTWPGVAGSVTVSPGVETAEVRLFVYADANANGRREDAERLLEAAAAFERFNVLIVYASREAAVSGDRGLNVTLASGWSAVGLELGRTLRTSVLPAGTRLNLAVTR